MTDEPWWRFHAGDGAPPPGASAGRGDPDALREAFGPASEPSGPFDPVVIVDFDAEDDVWTVTHWSSGSDYTLQTANRLDRALELARAVGAAVQLVGREQLFTDPTPEQVRAVEALVLEERALPRDAVVRPLDDTRTPPAPGGLRVDTYHAAPDGSPGTRSGSWEVSGATRDEVMRWLPSVAPFAPWVRIAGDPETDPAAFLAVPPQD